MRLHRRRNSVIPFCRRPGTTNRATFTRPTALPQGLSLPQSRSRVAYALALLLSILMGGISAAQAQAVRSNPGFTAASIPRNDDGSTDTAIDLGFDVNFFGANFRTAFVNNNGNITFGGPLSTFTPEGLVASPLRIIAPFWADVDTRASRSALVTYGRDIVDGRPAFGANWVNVGYFGTHDDKLNSFQLVLIDRSDIAPGDFDVEFNYDRIEWETGDASGGSGGLGGTSASAGYSNGTGKPEASFEILGSRINGIFLDNNRNGLRYRRLNSSVRGRLNFFVRSGFVGCTYSILTLSLDYPWEGGEGALQIAAPFECEWTATSSAGFVTFTSPTTGQGSQVLQFTVEPNRNPFRRSATLTVAGQTIVITQAAFVTLSMTPPAVTLTTVDGSFPSKVVMRLDAISGTVDWVASAELLTGENWRFNITPSFGTVTAGSPLTLLLELNAGFQPPSSGSALITVTDTTNGPSIGVPITLDVAPSGGRLVLSQTSFVFRAPQGGSLPASQTLTLLNSSTGSLDWSIPGSALAEAPWLSFSSMSGTVTTGSTTPSSTVLSANSVGLEAGIYQAVVPISAPNSQAETQVISVSLQVVESSTAPAGEISPGGLLFVTKQGEGAPPKQILSLANQGGAGALSFELEAFTAAGGPWIWISATSGNIGTIPTTVQVSANPAGLPAGVYNGRIAASYSTGKAQDSQVTLIVVPEDRKSFFGTSACLPQSMTMLNTSVGGSTDVAVSFPVPLTANLVDSCGNPLDSATVLVSVEGAVISLPAVGRGLYRGTWTPAQTAPLTTIKFVALHPVYGALELSVTVSVVPAPGDVNLPYITADGVIEAAGLQALRPLAPGGIVFIFGSGFASEELQAIGAPLARSLGGVSVRFGSEDAPLYFVSPTQITAQVPFAARQGDVLPIVVTVNGRVSAPQSYLITAAQPGIFSTDGAATAFDSQGRPINPQNPALLGDTIYIYAAGLGLVDPPVATGAVSPSSTTVLEPVEVFVEGFEVPVTFQGLAPGLVGVYQINFALPDILIPGNDVPVVIRQIGVLSNTVSMPLRAP